MSHVCKILNVYLTNYSVFFISFQVDNIMAMDNTLLSLV